MIKFSNHYKIGIHLLSIVVSLIKKWAKNDREWKILRKTMKTTKEGNII